MWLISEQGQTCVISSAPRHNLPQRQFSTPRTHFKLFFFFFLKCFIQINSSNQGPFNRTQSALTRKDTPCYIWPLSMVSVVARARKLTWMEYIQNTAWCQSDSSTSWSGVHLVIVLWVYCFSYRLYMFSTYSTSVKWTRMVPRPSVQPAQALRHIHLKYTRHHFGSFVLTFTLSQHSCRLCHCVSTPSVRLPWLQEDARKQGHELSQWGFRAQALREDISIGSGTMHIHEVVVVVLTFPGSSPHQDHVVPVHVTCCCFCFLVAHCWLAEEALRYSYCCLLPSLHWPEFG